MTRISGDDAGFSLVEMVVALAILSLILTGMVQAVRESLSSVGTANRMSDAAAALSAQWAHLEREGFIEGQSEGELEDGRRWLCSVSPASDPRFYYVVLQLFWNDGSRERQASIDSLVTVPLEE